MAFSHICGENQEQTTHAETMKNIQFYQKGSTCNVAAEERLIAEKTTLKKKISTLHKHDREDSFESISEISKTPPFPSSKVQKRKILLLEERLGTLAYAQPIEKEFFEVLTSENSESASAAMIQGDLATA